MSMRYLVAVAVLSCVIWEPGIVEAERRPDSVPATEFVFFRFDWGIFGRVPAAEVSISKDGSGAIFLVHADKSREQIPLSLDANEMTALVVLAEAAGFSSLKADTLRWTDAGICTLRISTERWHREMKYDRPWPQLLEVSDLLIGLVHQGIALSELRKSQRADFAWSILAPSDRGGVWPRAPQPRALKTPLMDFIRNCERGWNQ